MAAYIGTATSRIDGIAKVTGTAHYGSDVPFSNPAYGFLVTSPISRGRIVSAEFMTAAKGRIAFSRM